MLLAIATVQTLSGTVFMSRLPSKAGHRFFARISGAGAWRYKSSEQVETKLKTDFRPRWARVGP